MAYLAGLLVLWIKNGGRKSFRVLYQEFEYHEVRVEAISFFLKVFAGIGAAAMIAAVLFMLSYLIWKGIK